MSWWSCWPSVWCSVSPGSAVGIGRSSGAFSFLAGGAIFGDIVDVAWGGGFGRGRGVLDGLLVSLVGLGGWGVGRGVGVVAGRQGRLFNIPCLTVVDTKHG